MYRLFGKPKNAGEFADKARRVGQSCVDISVGDEKESIIAGASFHHFPLVLRTETDHLKVGGATAINVWGFGTREDELRNLIAQHNALIRAIKVGRYLEGQGLGVTIQGAPIDQTRREIDGYRQRIESKSREYGYNLKDEEAPPIWSLQ